jgi:hypothetical protein
MVSYSFGGMQFIVRYETDGYIGVARTQQRTQSACNRGPSFDDLSIIIDSLSLSQGRSVHGRADTAESKLVIQKEGQVVPLQSTLEVKTRVAHRPLAFDDVVAQLWVSQTPNLVRAYHTKGVFAAPKVRDVAAQVQAWEAQNQEELRLLAGLIEEIRDIV